MKSAPLVSVVVPSYNHARFLPERLDSILGQSFTDLEVIVLDDASSDNSAEIIEEYASKEDRIRHRINEKNSGSVFVQWITGVGMARGKYVWIAESDDVAHPDLLQELVPKLEQNGTLAVAQCASIIIDENGKQKGSTIPWTDDLAPGRWAVDHVNDGNAECRSYMVVRSTVPNASAVLFRKAMFEEVDKEIPLRLCGDRLFWSRLLTKGGICYCAKPLNFFRKHSGSVTHAWKARLYASESLVVTREVHARYAYAGKEQKELAVKLMAYWGRLIKAGGSLSLFPLTGFLWRLDSGIALKFFFTYSMDLFAHLLKAPLRSVKRSVTGR